MKISIVRSSNIAIGSILLLLILSQEQLSSQGYAFLALLAIPFVLAGLLDWRPLSYIVYKLKQRLPAWHLSRHADA